MRTDKLVGEILGDEMAITPSDLYNREFSTSLIGGYDKTEVDAFLERVGDVFERLFGQVRELKEQTETQKARIQEFHEMEHTLRSALASSQRFSDDLLESARTRAESLLEEARVKAERIQADAERGPQRLRAEIDALQAERARLRGDIEAVLAAHAALLERLPRAESAHAPEPEEDPGEEQTLNAIPEPWDGGDEYEEADE